jgi:peptide/nickel transport system substrate-binding protein
VANWVFLGFNTRRPFFDTRAERQAIALAIDRQAIVDGIMGGHNTVGRSLVTPVHRAFDRTSAALTRPHADTSTARALLEGAGWRDRNGDGVREDASGRPFRFALMVWQGSGSYQEMAQVIQAQLRAVGVAVEVDVVEFNRFLAQIEGREREFDAAIGNWTDNLRKDDAQLFHSRNAAGPRAWTGFASPRTDALMDSLAITLDPARARALWREYQLAMAEEAPMVVLFYARGINGVRTALQGVSADWRGPLASVQRWWMETEEAGG